jgi:magnesium-transporting ATPase (P-type)
MRPERDANRPEWDGTEYTPIQLENDTNSLEQDSIGHFNHVATRSDSDTLNAPDQDIYHASTSVTSIDKPKKPQSAWARLSTTWWMEIITIFLSTGFIIGLIAILASFQNRLTTEWTFFISINAVVAIVITAARATLLATVSVCLSQEKWNHFNNRARRLQDLNIIDRASRGPLGSIQMLFSVSWGLATVSAVVMILSLLTDSFVQQVVSFQPGNIYAHQDGSATFGHALSYSSGLDYSLGASMHDGMLILNKDYG